MKVFSTLACLSLTTGPLIAQSGRLSGTVSDSAGGGLAGALATLQAASAPAVRAATDAQGRFRLELPAGMYAATVQRIGYRAWRDSIHVVAGDEVLLAAVLAPLPLQVDPIVISVSRGAESSFGAPAAVSVIGPEDIAAHPRATTTDHVRDVPGVLVVSKGLVSRSYAIRGPVGVLNDGVLSLVDYRYSNVPSLGFNVPALDPTIESDIERIEVVRGPSAALYGPTSRQGVLHTITRSPFSSPGGSMQLGAGGRSYTEAAGRAAGTIGANFGWRLAGGWSRGYDWQATDSVEASSRAAALAEGADPDTLLVGSRNSVTDRLGVTARGEWRGGTGTTITGDLGWAQFSGVELSNVGATQVRDWRYGFAQARLNSGRFFANLIADLSDAGRTYQLRTGQPLVDHSRLYAAQLQHGARFGPVGLTYGADVQLTDPRTDGTIHGRNEDDDRVVQTGAYVSGTWAVGPRLDLVGAVRADHHDRIGGVGWSPRLGLVLRPAATHALRVTFNRGFTLPLPSDMFVDIRVGSALGYGIQYVGGPVTGLHFRRDCGGPCMQSPFTADPSQYGPADATRGWAGVVAILQDSGIDLSSLPAPTAADVSTTLALLTSSGFRPVTAADIADLAPLKPTITDAWELGYKGTLTDRVAVTVDVYRNQVRDLIPDVVPVTPNAFLERTTLEQYLVAAGVPAAQAAPIAAFASRIPTGTITPVESRDPAAIVMAVPGQGGSYTVWGAELALEWQLTRRWDVLGSYTWASEDSVPGLYGGQSLDQPKHRGALGLRWRDAGRGRSVEVRARALASYPVSQGSMSGRVPGYAMLDVALSWRLPARRPLDLLLTVDNVFDRRHNETVGGPMLGRFVVLRLRVAV